MTVLLIITIFIFGSAAISAGDEATAGVAFLLAALHYPPSQISLWLSGKFPRFKKASSRLRLFSLLVLTAATITSAIAVIDDPLASTAPALLVSGLVLFAIYGFSLFGIASARRRGRQVSQDSDASPPTGATLPSYFRFHERRPIAGHLCRAAAWGPFYVMFGIVITLSSIWGGDVMGLAIAGVVLGGAIWMFPAFLLEVTGLRLLAPSARQLLAEDPRPPVLFLRSFGEESAKMPIAGLQYEESLVAVLQRVGPVVAVGRPYSPLPEIGAARLYLLDSGWQRGVQFLLENSRAVVLQVAETEGVSWEIEHVLRVTPLERLVLFFPVVKSDGRVLRWVATHSPDLAYILATRVHFTVRIQGQLALSVFDRSRSELRQAKWSRFRERFGALLAEPLPEQIGEAEFVVFGPDGIPELVNLPSIEADAENVEGADIIEAALRTFLLRFKLKAAKR